VVDILRSVLAMQSCKVNTGLVEPVSPFLKLKAVHEKCFYFSAFIASASIVLLLLLEADGRVSDAHGLARYFFCISVITGVVSSGVAMMVMFYFEGVDMAYGFECVFAWLPVVVGDISFLELAMGLCYFLRDRSSGQLWGGFVGYTGAWIAFCVALSVWMLCKLRVKARL
jgi:hypothetical protein